MRLPQLGIQLEGLAVVVRRESCVPSRGSDVAKDAVAVARRRLGGEGTVGGTFGLLSFCIVAMGGFGSISGAFIAGLLVGLVQTLGGYFFDPAYKYAIVFLLYLLTVWIRPQGLLGW